MLKYSSLKYHVEAVIWCDTDLAKWGWALRGSVPSGLPFGSCIVVLGDEGMPK